MVRFPNSLYLNFVGSFLLVMILVSSTTFEIMEDQSQDALLQATRDDIYQMIGLLAVQFTPEEITRMAALKPGDEDSDFFKATRQKMWDMRAHAPDIMNIYTMKVTDGKVTFLIDDLKSGDLPKEAAKIGDLYEEPPKELFEGLKAQTVNEDIYTDEWGSFLSGYAPLRDENGEVVALLAADMLATTIKAKQTYIDDIIYYIILTSFILSALVISYFAHDIIRDLKKIDKGMACHMSGRKCQDLALRRKDELGQLAESIDEAARNLKPLLRRRGGM